MAETRFPEYVTDGYHIYLWHEEYEKLFTEGKLRGCEPPELPKVHKLTQRERTKLEEARKKALKEAEAAVRLFKNTAPADLETLFGSEPQDES